jgi:hypothetical protein
MLISDLRSSVDTLEISISLHGRKGIGLEKSREMDAGKRRGWMRREKNCKVRKKNNRRFELVCMWQK